MISVTKLKEKLGSSAQGLSKKDLKRILEIGGGLAALFFDMWLESKSKREEKNGVNLLP